MNRHKPIVLLSFLIGGIVHAQNLVPNPSFETSGDCLGLPPAAFCTVNWNDNWGTSNPAMNTPDLAHNPNFFFPPYTIDPFHGARYMGLDCSIQNPEYIQVRLTSPLTAGTTYCVTFRSAVCEEATLPATTMGAYFTVAQLTENPYVTGLDAHVQGTVSQDPAAWTTINGTYTASGGEEFITLGGFQNTANNPDGTEFSYMYIDLVEVYAISSFNLGNDRQICNGENTLLDAGSDGGSYLWSTGQTTPSITVTAPGTYSVQKQVGMCFVSDTIVLSSCGSDPEPQEPNNPDPGPEPEPGPVNPPVTALPAGAIYCPNAFTPNGDGFNNRFGAKGDSVQLFELTVFDRWGEIVFHSTDIEQHWDGTHEGRPAMEGLYSYELIYQLTGSARRRTNGHVALLR